jgi:hypothetical protein
MSLQQLIAIADHITRKENPNIVAVFVTHKGEQSLVFPKENETTRDFKRRMVKAVQLCVHKLLRFETVYTQNEFDGVGVS